MTALNELLDDWHESFKIFRKVRYIFTCTNVLIDGIIQQLVYRGHSLGKSSGFRRSINEIFNLLRPTAQVMHQQFNIQQLYALLTMYLCVLYLSENKQRLVPLIA